MGNKLSRNKILLIVCSFLLVAIVVLVVVITKVNKDTTSDNELKSNSSENTSSDSNITSNTSILDQTNDSDITKDNIPDENNSPDPTKPEEIRVTENNECKVLLGEYKGIKAIYSPVIITDEDIDNNLKMLQSENTVIVEMPDRPFEKGDMAIVSYDGKVDGEFIKGLDVVYLQVVLGKGIIPSAIEESIIGKKKGDSFDVEIEYPSDFDSFKEIAGKTVVYSVEIADAFEFDIPDINDSFISSVTEYSSVEAYKSGEKERLQNEENEIARKAVIDDLKHKVVDNCTFEKNIDKEIKKAYVQLLENENSEMIDNYWMDADTYYQLMYDYEPGEYQKKLMESVTYDIKYTYILDEIAKQENFQVSEEEYNKYITETYLTDGGYESEENLYQTLGEDNVKSTVNTAILRSKASELIYDSADIGGLDR